MARPLRIEFIGGLYHVTARGDGREDIYLSDADRHLFLAVLSDVVDRFNWTIHAYCLMSNHYHLLVETPEANLSKGMRQLNGVYTQAFNKAHHRVGHVFQGRYKAIVVEKEAYLLELARYVVLNPVRSGMVRTPGDWPWSSYRATIGEECTPDWLATQWVLSAFGESMSEAVAAYTRSVAEGHRQAATPWGQLKQQLFLGSDAFVGSVLGCLRAGSDLREVPQARARPVPKPLADFVRQYDDRNGAITAAYASGGYTLKDIGDYFGLHYSRVSKIVRLGGCARQEEKSKT